MKAKRYIIENYLFRKHLEEGEHIKYAIHLHPLSYHLKFYSIKFIYFLLPILLIVFFPVLMPMALILTVVGLLRVGLLYFDWHYNVWLVTNKGVLTVRAENLWHRNSSRVEHEMIAGVIYEIEGFVGSFLNYGILTLEKAGNATEILKMKNVHKPREAELNIVKHQKACMKEKLSAENNLLKDLLQKVNFTPISTAEASKFASIPHLDFR